MITVLPLKNDCRLSCIIFSFSASSTDVTSSNKVKLGFLYTAQAIKILCFCPPEIPFPNELILVFNPNGKSLINSFKLDISNAWFNLL